MPAYEALAAVSNQGALKRKDNGAQYVLQVIKSSSDAELGSVVTTDAIAAAIRQQLSIELAPQLISLPEPITGIGDYSAILRVTLADGSKPVLKLHLSQT